MESLGSGEKVCVATRPLMKDSDQGPQSPSTNQLLSSAPSNHAICTPTALLHTRTHSRTQGQITEAITFSRLL